MKYVASLVLSLLVVLPVSAGAVPDYLAELSQLVSIGNYSAALAGIEAHLAAGNADPGLLRLAGQCYYATQEYAAAAEQYAALAAETDSPEELLEARTWQWRSHHQHDSDGTASWTATATAEVDQRLLNTALRNDRERQLALELEFTLEQLVGKATLPGEELRREYPESPVVLKSAKAQLSRIAGEPDDETRLDYLDEFTAYYPGCYWLHDAYRLKLYTAWKLSDRTLAKAVARDYLTVFPASALAYGTASRYLLDLGADMELSEEYALYAVNKYEAELGIVNLMTDIRRLAEEAGREPRQPNYLIPGKREQFLEYLGAVFNYCRHLNLTGDYAAAQMYLDVIAELELYQDLPDYDFAPLYYLRGLVYQETGDTPVATRSFIRASLISNGKYSTHSLHQLEQMGKNEFYTLRKDSTEVEELAEVATPQFSDVTTAYGLSEVAVKNMSWCDIDNDDDPDLVADGHLLFINNAGGPAGRPGFTDFSSVIPVTSPTNSAASADFDNDGDVDLYVCGTYGQYDYLLRNELINRKGVSELEFFDMVPLVNHPTDSHNSSAAIWFDHNQDGLLDIYVANGLPDANSAFSRIPSQPEDALYLRAENGDFDNLLPTLPYRQARRLSAADSIGVVAIANLDDNTVPELYAGHFQLNMNALIADTASSLAETGSFLNLFGTATGGYWGHTSSAAFADYNSDGRQDLLLLNFVNRQFDYFCDTSHLFLADSGAEYGFTDEYAAWQFPLLNGVCQAIAGDINNDTRIDLLITSQDEANRSLVLLNTGTGFTEASAASGLVLGNATSAALTDFDLDGDLDIAYCTGTYLRLLENRGTTGNWLKVRCVGAAKKDTRRTGVSNRSAIGAVVRLSFDGKTLLREVTSATGTGSGRELVVHFGLGTYRGAVELEVTFPSGIVHRETISTPNQLHTVFESTASGIATLEPEVASQPEEPANDSATEEPTEGTASEETDLTRPESR
jgi:hypothetical protein